MPEMSYTLALIQVQSHVLSLEEGNYKWSIIVA